MQKNFKRTAFLGLLIGCMIVGAFGVLALTNGNAYQSVKDAALKTAQAENMTVKADVSVKQDGKTLLSGEAVMQTDGKNSYSSSQIKSNGSTLDMESSTSENGDSIIRVGDEYTIRAMGKINGKEDEKERFNMDENTMKMAEMLIDMVIGDVKTHFTGNEGKVTVNLEDAQIPELLNVALSAMIEQKAGAENIASPEDRLFSAAFDSFAITKDIKITRITFESTLENGYLNDSTFTVVITGKDESDAAHEVEIICNASFSDIGSTAPNTINTEGKEITDIGDLLNGAIDAGAFMEYFGGR